MKPIMVIPLVLALSTRLIADPAPAITSAPTIAQIQEENLKKGFEKIFSEQKQRESEEAAEKAKQCAIAQKKEVEKQSAEIQAIKAKQDYQATDTYNLKRDVRLGVDPY